MGAVVGHRKAETEKELLKDFIRVCRNAHQLECIRIDEEYFELCRSIEAANKRLTGAWEAKNLALTVEHTLLCGEVNVQNLRQHMAWESAIAARMAKHTHKCDTHPFHKPPPSCGLGKPPTRLGSRRKSDGNSVWQVRRPKSTGWSPICSTQRSARTSRFAQRKSEASGAVSTFDKAKQKYEEDLRERP